MPPRISARRIVVRCPNWIGDMVAATAALRCIRRNYPEARMDLLLRPYVRPVVENAPWFDGVIEQTRDAGLGEVLRVSVTLRHGPRYDLAVLLTHSFSSALTVWLGRARRRVGHARNGRSFLLTDPVPWPGREPDADRVPKVAVYSSLLECLGCEGADDMRPELFTSSEDEALCDRLLAEGGRDPKRGLLAVAPGAAYGASKLWPPMRFAEAADRLAEARGLQAALLTGPGEHPIGREIARHMGGGPVLFPDGALTFGALKALVRRSALMICNDSGPRHVGIAFNVPTVVIMGPTDPVVTRSGYKRTVILRQDVPCGPCRLRECPTNHLCMTRITVDMVVAAAEELLDQYGQEPLAESAEEAENDKSRVTKGP